MAKATIISISPAPLKNANPSVVPPNIIIPACSDENKPVCVVIEDRKTWHYIPLQERGRPRIRWETIPAIEHAKSVVADHVRKVVSSSAHAHPGIIAVEGSITVVPKEILLELKKVQDVWKERVITHADDLWQKYRQRKFISDIAVLVARTLGLENEKEWAKIIVKDAKLTKNCPACYGVVHVDALICLHCRTIIDPKKYKEQFTALTS